MFGVLICSFVSVLPLFLSLLCFQSLLTYSSGVVLTIALGFPLLNCKRKRAQTSSTVTARDLDPLELDMT